jgi:hypothetical protein
MSDEIQRLKERLNETGSLSDARALREVQLALPDTPLVYEDIGAGLFKAERKL